MKPHRTARRAAVRGWAIVVLALPVVAGCTSDGDSTTTLAPATSERTSSTAPLDRGHTVDRSTR